MFLEQSKRPQTSGHAQISRFLLSRKTIESPYERQKLKKFYASFSLWVLTPTKLFISYSPAPLPTQVKFQILEDVSRFDAFLQNQQEQLQHL